MEANQKTNQKANELVLFILAIIPVVYFLLNWQGLPSKLPIHYDLNMKPNGWGTKGGTLMILICLSVGMYLLFKYIGRIDPKGKYANNPKLLIKVRFIVGFFISLISCLITVMALYQNAVEFNYKIIAIAVGLLLVLLGNYMPTLKQNYFIGIRTPWALDNETNWMKTQKLGGKLFFVMGVLIILISVFCNSEITFTSLVVLPIVAAVTSFAYSYFLFKDAKKKVGN